ncbi:T9SS type A sorting domain-containing protein [Candidatus Cloacimonadota bacterium]
MESWWGTQDPEDVYYIATYDWSEIGVYMPYAAEVYDSYSLFGNGYVPFFTVIGNQNLVIYGDNDYAPAQNSVPDAIYTFEHLFLLDPVEDQSLEYNSELEIDLTGVFFDPNENDITVFVTGNTSPEVINATVDGLTLTLTSYEEWGNSEITLTGMAGADAVQTSFNTMVLPNTVEIPYEVEDSPDQQVYPNNQNPFSNSLTDLGWTQIDVTESNQIVHVRVNLTWNSVDYATEGSLHITSPSGTEAVLYQSTAVGPTSLDLTVYDFVAEDMAGTWDLYIMDSYGDGGHIVSDCTVYFAVAGGTDADDVLDIPTALNGNYPNPFNPTTTISYSINKSDNVSLEIYNVKGQLVKTLVNEYVEAGTQEVIWNGLDDSRNRVSSGVYFYKLNTGDYSSTKKMILLK